MSTIILGIIVIFLLFALILPKEATWDKVNVFGFVDQDKNVQLKAGPPKTWLEKLTEEIMPWVIFLLGFLFGLFLGVFW